MIQIAACPVENGVSVDGGLARTADTAPWQAIEELRERGPVVWDGVLGGWLITSYELMREIGRADQTIWGNFGDAGLTGNTSWLERFDMTPAEWNEFHTYGATKNMFAVGGEAHHHQHKWWMRVFSGQTLRYLGRTVVEPVAHAEIDHFQDRGKVDLSSEFAKRVSPRVMSATMGLPWEDDSFVERIIELQRRRATLIGRRFTAPDREVDALVTREGREAVRELTELFRPFVEARRGATGKDFISLVWRDAEEMFGPDYELIDVIGTVATAWAGGAGTSADATTGAIYLLLTHRSLQDELRLSDDAGIRRFVEECFRLYGSQTLRERYALKDTNLAGTEINAGQVVVGLMHAGNRDPGHYACPDDIDLTRKPSHDHFAFGLQSLRACPGQGLARKQLQTVISILLDRLRNVRLDPAAEEPRYRGSFLRYWEPLNVLFDVGGPISGVCESPASYVAAQRDEYLTRQPTVSWIGDRRGGRGEARRASPRPERGTRSEAASSFHRRIGRSHDGHPDDFSPIDLCRDPERARRGAGRELVIPASPRLVVAAGIDVFRPGFGALRLTGADYWGLPTDLPAARAVLRRALDLGVDFIDTAHSYGASEELIAETLFPYPEGLTIATKGGLRREGRYPTIGAPWRPDGRPDHLRKACEESLRRLRLERIDLYQLHSPDPDVPFDESVGALKDLRDEGKIGHIGLSNVGLSELAAARRITEVVSVQNRFSVFDREHEDVVAVCERDGLAFVCWQPLARGGESLTAAARPVRLVASTHGVTVAQVAIAWLLHRSPCILPIPGTTSVEHLEQNVAAARLALSADDVAKLG